MVPTAFNIGLATTFPPVAASYQTIVLPGAAFAVAVSVCKGELSHSVWSPPLIGAAGAPCMVRPTAVLVVLVHPLTSSTLSA